MPLVPGARLGRYEIKGALGRGGMGEVYRATDTRLGRDVAIKVLPDEYASSPIRLLRLEREAKALAALNHPNVATLYGLERDDGTSYLAIELVEGPTLAERIRPGQIPSRQALGLFVQIAEGLEEAHRKGVVHRDLKPSNIKIAPSGQIKILDFGLAKLLSEEQTPEDEVASSGPTPTQTLTGPQQALGTPAYMSPEAITGGVVDARTDIWALGCCLYEALSGKRAFRGMSKNETLVNVLSGEPDWDALAEIADDRIRELVARCLRKDPRDRLHHAADVRIELEMALGRASAGHAVISAVSARPRRRWVLLAVATAALLAGFALGVLVTRVLSAGAGRVKETRQLSIVPPPDTSLAKHLAGSLDISPDGRVIAFVASDRTRHRRLYLRRMGEVASNAVPGADGADGPFFSPDGRWVAFKSGGKLKKVPVDGGPTADICDAPTFLGGTWLGDDTIVLTDGDHLLRVPAAGGTPTIVATADLDRPEHFRGPVGLPGDRRVLITAASERVGRVISVSLDDGSVTEVLKGTYPFARYASSGHLLHAEDGFLFATPFDAEQGKLQGRRVTVRRGLETIDGIGGFYAVALDGTLVFAPESTAAAANMHLVWRKPQGAVDRITQTPKWFSAPRLSPNGDRIAVTLMESSRDYDVCVYDLERRTLRKLTLESNNDSPVWSPDGRRLAFVSYRDGAARLYVQPADGGQAVLIPSALGRGDSELYRYPTSWSPTQDLLLFHYLNVSTLWDVAAVPVEGGERELIAATAANEFGAQFSPDGSSIAYVSDESGREEVFVEPYPKTGARWPVSDGGGVFPLWSPSGDEIFFVTLDGEVRAVRIDTSSHFTTGASRLLFRTEDRYSRLRPVAELAVARDGETFLDLEMVDVPPTGWQLVVVLDWLTELERQAGS